MLGPFGLEGWRGLGGRAAVQLDAAVATRGLLIVGGCVVAVLVVAVVCRLAVRRGPPRRRRRPPRAARRSPRCEAGDPPRSRAHPDPWATTPIPVIAAPPHGVRVAPYVRHPQQRAPRPVSRP